MLINDCSGKVFQGGFVCDVAALVVAFNTVDDTDMGTVLSEFFSGTKTDPVGAAGDDDYFVLEHSDTSRLFRTIIAQERKKSQLKKFTGDSDGGELHLSGIHKLVETSLLVQMSGNEPLTSWMPSIFRLDTGGKISVNIPKTRQNPNIFTIQISIRYIGFRCR